MAWATVSRATWHLLPQQAQDSQHLQSVLSIHHKSRNQEAWGWAEPLRQLAGKQTAKGLHTSVPSSSLSPPHPRASHALGPKEASIPQLPELGATVSQEVLLSAGLGMQHGWDGRASHCPWEPRAPPLYS